MDKGSDPELDAGLAEPGGRPLPGRGVVVTALVALRGVVPLDDLGGPGVLRVPGPEVRRGIVLPAGRAALQLPTDDGPVGGVGAADVLDAAGLLAGQRLEDRGRRLPTSGLRVVAVGVHVQHPDVPDLQRLTLVDGLARRY